MGRISSWFKGDRVIWVVIVLLCLMSLLLVYSSTGMLAYRKYDGNTFYFVFKRFIYILMGFGVILIFQRISYYKWVNWAYILGFIAFLILVYASFFGANLNDASRWIKLPIIGITIQASEPAKIGLILLVSRILYDNRVGDKLSKRGFWIGIIAIGIICGTIFWHDFSTSVLLGLVCYILLFLGNAPAKIMALFTTGVIAFGIIFILLIPYLPDVGRLHTIHSRIFGIETTDIQKKSDSQLQKEQAKIAVVSGGLIVGKGPGNSTQRNFLPHPYSDFIFAIVLEEYGYVFGFSIMLLYLILLYRIGIIMQKINSVTGVFLVAGLGLMIVFQALVNMGVSTNSLPVTGQPLPLVSMGGSSLLFTCMALGIILNISKVANENAAENKA